MYLLTISHTHLLLTTPTSHTHRFHPLSKIVIHTSAHPYCTEVWMTILESGWNLWVWLVGVVSRRWVWLMVRRYIDILTMIINFPYATCINSFFGSCIPTSLFIFKMFFRSCFCYFLTIYSKRCSQNIRDRSKKSRFRDYNNNLIISIIKNVKLASTARARARVPRLPRARYGIRSE